MALTDINVKIFIGCIDDIDIIYDPKLSVIEMYDGFEMIFGVPLEEARGLNHGYIQYSVNKIDQLTGGQNE